MTRINCIPPSELSGPHLVAEYRELPRIFGLARAAWERGEKFDDERNPKAYTLGKGHVRFFYPRLGFLVKRQRAIIVEMKLRGYKPTFADPERLLDGIPKEWCADWIPDREAIALNRQRIKERSTAS